jgi:hypothetical protein
MNISITQAEDMIRSSGGQIFGVTFIKRTDGSERQMTCRLGVHSYLKGGDPAYDARSHGLVTVFDMQKAGYRSISLEGLIGLSINGNKYDVSSSR